ncbi:MAG: glycosyltransferase involved in cell wall biosynthesis [Granulosicoccus sp.]
MVNFAIGDEPTPMTQSLHICHVTTIHPSKDVRIFHKECRSLAKAGYRVTLLVGNGESEKIDGVDIIGIPVSFSGRMSRFLNLGKALYRAALSQNADVYHFHDPEFLPHASKLAKAGKKVVYDVHEDLPRQILGKHYLPKLVAIVLAGIAEFFEDRVAKRMSHIITATDYIRARYLKLNSNTTTVKNYPILQDDLKPNQFSEKERAVCYIGAIAKVRGIVQMVDSMQYVEGEFHLGGKFNPPDLRNQVVLKPGWKKVNEHGFVNRTEAFSILKRSKVGFVVLEPIINYLDALPVKMFEYMAAGIPVVASDFPLWRSIIEKWDCGICVDPNDPKAIAEAVNRLLDDDGPAQQMGLNGRRGVEEECNWGNEEKFLLNVYSQLS